jgi:hypothetical protein
MTIQSLQLEIISRITQVRNKKKLEAIISMIPKEGESDWWDELSDQDKASIERGLAEVEKGHTISMEEAQKRLLNS